MKTKSLQISPYLFSNMGEVLVFSDLINDSPPLPINLTTKNIAELRDQAEKVKHLFKERKQKITDIKFDADKVEVKIDYHGTLAVDFSDELKKGDTIKLKGTSIFRFKNNKIIELKDIS